MVTEREVQLTDTIILLLSSQSFKEINSMEGKLYLKQSLLTRINQLLGGQIVRRIYFTEFVVQ
jgi:flagellar FliL protein